VLGALVQWGATMLVRRSLKLFMDIWPNHAPTLIFSFYTCIPNCLCKTYAPTRGVSSQSSNHQMDHGLNKAVGIRILVPMIPIGRSNYTRNHIATCCVWIGPQLFQTPDHNFKVISCELLVHYLGTYDT